MSPIGIENIGASLSTQVTGMDGSVGGVDPDLRSARNLGVSGPDSSGVESPGAEGGSFVSMLEDSLNKVNQLQGEADSAIKNLVAGRSKNIHETMVTLESADLSLRLMMQVRNKIIEAYKEIMKMQV